MAVVFAFDPPSAVRVPSKREEIAYRMPKGSIQHVPTVAGQGSRLPAPIRRAAILWAFAKEAVTCGSIERVSMRAVAKRAGCTTPVVYRLLGSRQELVREAVRWTYGELVDDLEKAASAKELAPFERLALVADALDTRGLGDRELFEALVATECRHDPGLGTHVRSVIERCVELLTRILRDGVEAGEIPADAHCEYYAWRFIDIGLVRNQLFMLDVRRAEEIGYLRLAFRSLMGEIFGSELLDHLLDASGRRKTSTGRGTTRRRQGR